MRENEEDAMELRKECLYKVPPALLKHCSYSPCLLDLPMPSPPPWQLGDVVALELFVLALLPL